jgi:polyisoprenoid-binding protein YceI
MKPLIPILVLVAFSAYGQKDLVVDSSSVTFQIRNAGFIVEGTFSGFTAELAFNPRRLKHSTIVGSVEASTVDTGIRIRNNHLRRVDYFDVENYPRITLRSSNFRTNGDEFIGDFILELKGKKGRINIPFTFRRIGNAYVFSGSTEINRRDYDIGEKSMILDDRVQIKIWTRAIEKSR